MRESKFFDIDGDAFSVIGSKGIVKLVGDISGFHFTPEQAREIALAILAEADPALAAKVKAVDALISSAKVGLHAINGLIDMEPMLGIRDSTMRQSKVLVEAALRSAGVEVARNTPAT